MRTLTASLSHEMIVRDASTSHLENCETRVYLILVHVRFTVALVRGYESSL